jgi:hypothetical protein
MWWGVYWWRLMRIDLYGVQRGVKCKILANNKKAPPGQTLFLEFLFSGAFLRISNFQIFFVEPVTNFSEFIRQ